jgi:hypothetical protein
MSWILTYFGSIECVPFGTLESFGSCHPTALKLPPRLYWQSNSAFRQLLPDVNPILKSVHVHSPTVSHPTSKAQPLPRNDWSLVCSYGQQPGTCTRNVVSAWIPSHATFFLRWCL